ncbi:MAG: hypothetical protein KME33_28165 [Aetokthonos hydrillicola CCALA 1050]|nr:hypothetical protein [Aetokthonos hydrillicola CCALA 1050]
MGQWAWGNGHGAWGMGHGGASAPLRVPRLEASGVIGHKGLGVRLLRTPCSPIFE